MLLFNRELYDRAMATTAGSVGVAIPILDGLACGQAEQLAFQCVVDQVVNGGGGALTLTLYVNASNDGGSTFPTYYVPINAVDIRTLNTTYVLSGTISAVEYDALQMQLILAGTGSVGARVRLRVAGRGSRPAQARRYAGLPTGKDLGGCGCSGGSCGGSAPALARGDGGAMGRGMGRATGPEYELMDQGCVDLLGKCNSGNCGNCSDCVDAFAKAQIDAGICGPNNPNPGLCWEKHYDALAQMYSCCNTQDPNKNCISACWLADLKCKGGCKGNKACESGCKSCSQPKPNPKDAPSNKPNPADTGGGWVGVP